MGKETPIDSLIVGDLVHHNAHAWLEGPIIKGKPSPNLSSWQQALTELRQFGDATVYGGRGTATSLNDAISEQLRYLKTIDTLVAEYVSQLDADALQGKDAGKHYRNLAQLAAEAFPGYALPYMIEYGVYGLAQQSAARAQRKQPSPGGADAVSE